MTYWHKALSTRSCKIVIFVFVCSTNRTGRKAVEFSGNLLSATVLHVPMDMKLSEIN